LHLVGYIKYTSSDARFQVNTSSVTLHSAVLLNNNNNNKPADRNVVQKEAEKRHKCKSLRKDTTYVEPETYDYTGNNWSHLKSNKRFRGKYGSHTKKAFNIFTQKRQLYLQHHT
jgi:hypothetical protein